MDKKLSEGSKIHGFLIEKIIPVPEIRVNTVRAIHEKSGAKVVHLQADDPENLMGVCFRTPPIDDTGLPHILEHIQLAGSRKYPLKEPFVELLRTSPATFLNAFTYPDRTVYPCASLIKSDLFNIADVYLDSVYHALLDEEKFKQEAWRFDFETPGDISSNLIINGIVFNEMKGVFDNLDRLISKFCLNTLFSDNAYGKESGGLPEAIPSLTFETFKEFHEKHAHPSNSYIFLYGDIPTAEYFKFLDNVLSEFNRIEIDTSIAIQPRWEQPRHEVIPYPIGEKEDAEGNAVVLVSFFTNELTNVTRMLSMKVISKYLIGDDSAPLKKALIESGLGKSLGTNSAESGYENELRDNYFTVGLRGTDLKHKDEIVALVLSTCSECVEKGLNKKKVEAALHQMELAAREIRGGMGPYPLHLMLDVYNAWVYDADPLLFLNIEKHLSVLRKRIEIEDGFLERMLQEMIIDNPHYTVLSFVPDKKVVELREQDFRSKMAETKAAMTAEELEQIVVEAAEFEQLQLTPDSPEALATISRVSLPEVPKEGYDLNSSLENNHGVPVIYTDMFSRGVNYLDLAFDLRGIGDDLIDYLPVFTAALKGMGAAGYDYAAMAEREIECTGGVEARVLVKGSIDDPYRVRPFLHISADVLDEKLHKMFGVMSDRVLRCDFGDAKRLKNIVLDEHTSFRAGLTSLTQTQMYGRKYASRSFSVNNSIDERIHGITQFRLLSKLIENFDSTSQKLVEKLQRIQEIILSSRQNLVAASFVGEKKQQALSYINRLKGGLGDNPAQVVELPDVYPVFGSREAIAMPSRAASNVVVFKSVGACHEDAPALLALNRALSYGYFWDEIRVKGGAYGGKANYDRLSAVYEFFSYADPNIKNTLDVYDNTLDFILNEMDLSVLGVEKIIVSSMPGIDYSLRATDAAGRMLYRYLWEETPGYRKVFRDRTLSLTGDDIRRAAENLKAAYKEACYCAICNREKLEIVNKELEERALEISDL